MMAMGSFNGRQNQAPLAEMNVVPLVDVMLVLLVIFIVTAPLLTHSVKIDLPRASSGANVTKPAHIEFAIRASGEMFWAGETVVDTALAERFAAAARQQPQPELHILADRDARYESVARVMSMAAKAGLKRIGFVTEPAAD